MAEKGFAKDPLSTLHSDLLPDQSFQSLKSREKRDTTTDLHPFHVSALNNPNSSGWNVQSTAEVTPDGKGYRSETIGTTDGIEKLNGGIAEFKGRNEHRSSAHHEGDDKNYVKKASESSNTHLQEHVVIGDENSGRVEKKFSSTTSSSHSQFEASEFQSDFNGSHPMKGQFAIDDHHLADFKESADAFQRRQQEMLQSRQVQQKEFKEQQHRQEREHREQVSEKFIRSEKQESTEKKVESVQEQSRKYVDMDKASPEYQQHVQFLMSQPGEIISNTVEYPKPNVKMITTVKRLPDGTIVRNKRYETEEVQPLQESRRSSTATSTTKQSTQKSEQQIHSEDNLKRHSQNTRERSTSPRKAVYKDSKTSNQQLQDFNKNTNEEVSQSYSSTKTSSHRFATESSSEVIEEYSDKTPTGVRKVTKPQDFSTHGFPSVRSDKVTLDRVSPKTEYIVSSPTPTSTPSKKIEQSIGPNGEIIYKISSESVKNVKHKSSSERVVETEIRETEPIEYTTSHPHIQGTPRHRAKSPDFSTQGFPSVRTPSKQTEPNTKPRSKSPDFSTQGFPSVRSPTKSTSNNLTNEEVIHKINKETVHKTNFQETSERIIEDQTTTNGYPSSKAPLRNHPDFSTNGFPSVKQTPKTTEVKVTIQPTNAGKPPTPTTASTPKKPPTSVESPQPRVILKEKEVDAAHRAFAASLRSSSPIDSPRRDSTDYQNRPGTRSSISSNRTYRRDGREGSHDSNSPSESSRHSTTTTTRPSPSRTLTKTATTKQSILKIRPTNGSSETVDVPQSPRSPKSPSTLKTVTTKTTVTSKPSSTTTTTTSNTVKSERPTPSYSSPTSSAPKNTNKTPSSTNPNEQYHINSTRNSITKDTHDELYNITNKTFMRNGSVERSEIPRKSMTPEREGPASNQRVPTRQSTKRDSIPRETSPRKNTSKTSTKRNSIDQESTTTTTTSSIRKDSYTIKESPEATRPSKPEPRPSQRPSSGKQEKSPRRPSASPVKSSPNSHPFDKEASPGLEPDNQYATEIEDLNQLEQQTNYVTKKEKTFDLSEPTEDDSPYPNYPTKEDELIFNTSSTSTKTSRNISKNINELFIDQERVPVAQRPSEPSYVTNGSPHPEKSPKPSKQYPQQPEETRQYVTSTVTTRRDSTEPKTKPSEGPVAPSKPVRPVFNNVEQNFEDHQVTSTTTTQRKTFIPEKSPVNDNVLPKPTSNGPSYNEPEDRPKKPFTNTVTSSSVKTLREKFDTDREESPKPTNLRSPSPGSSPKSPKSFILTKETTTVTEVNESYPESVKPSEAPDGGFISKQFHPQSEPKPEPQQVPEIPTSPTYRKKGLSRHETFEERCRQILGMESDGDTQGRYKKRPSLESHPSKEDKPLAKVKSKPKEKPLPSEEPDDEQEEPLSITNVKTSLKIQKEKLTKNVNEEEIVVNINTKRPQTPTLNSDDEEPELQRPKEPTKTPKLEIVEDQTPQQRKPSNPNDLWAVPSKPTKQRPHTNITETTEDFIATEKLIHSNTLETQSDVSSPIPSDEENEDTETETEGTRRPVKKPARTINNVEEIVEITINENEENINKSSIISVVKPNKNAPQETGPGKTPKERSPSLITTTKSKGSQDSSPVQPEFRKPSPSKTPRDRKPTEPTEKTTTKSSSQTNKTTTNTTIDTNTFKKEPSPSRRNSRKSSLEPSSIKDRLRNSPRKQTPKPSDKIDGENSSTSSSPSTSPTRYLGERRRSSNISVTTEIIIDHVAPMSPKSSPQSSPKLGSKSPKDKLPSHPEAHEKKPSDRSSRPRMPVTDRTDTAPVPRVTKKEKDIITRSTSEQQMKVSSPLQPEKETLKPSSPVKHDKRPTKCFTTKTVNLSAMDNILKSEDMENVIIDIQHAKSSREPSPDKIVPTPVPATLDTGKPRFPDVVQEPEDEPRKPSVITNIPIFEEESSELVSFQISEVNMDSINGHTEDQEILTKPTIEAPQSLDLHRPDDDSSLTVIEKVAKFVHSAEEVKKPKTSSPFHRELDTKGAKVPENDDCLLSINEKVDKFLKEAENVTKTKITTSRFMEKPRYDELDDELKTDECILSVSEKVNKFLETAEKLAPTQPQKSPKLVANIERSISKQDTNETNYVKLEDLSDNEDDDKISKMTTLTPQMSPKLVASVQKTIQTSSKQTSKDSQPQSEGEDEDQPDSEDDTIVPSKPLRHRTDSEASSEPEEFHEHNVNRQTISANSKTTKNISLENNIVWVENNEETELLTESPDEEDEEELVPLTKDHTTKIELKRQKDILNRPTVFDATSKTVTPNNVTKRKPNFSPKSPTKEANTKPAFPQTSTRTPSDSATPKKFVSRFQTTSVSKTRSRFEPSNKSPERSPVTSRPSATTTKASRTTSTIETKSLKTSKLSQPDSPVKEPREPREPHFMTKPKVKSTNRPLSPSKKTPLNDLKLTNESEEIDEQSIDEDSHEVLTHSDDDQKSPRTINTDSLVYAHEEVLINNNTSKSTLVRNDLIDESLDHHPSDSSDIKSPLKAKPKPTTTSITERTVDRKAPANGPSSTIATKTITTTTTTTSTSNPKPSKTIVTETIKTFVEKPPTKQTKSTTPHPTSSPLTKRVSTVTTQSVASRRNLFEKQSTAAPTMPQTKVSPTASKTVPDGRRPSYMDHTKASLEHIRRDSLELNKEKITRKTTTTEEDIQIVRNPNSAVKFTVPERDYRKEAPLAEAEEEDHEVYTMTEDEELNIEEIWELEVLEKLLETVTSYELRRRIRAQIRLVKKNIINEEIHDSKKSTSKFTESKIEKSSHIYESKFEEEQHESRSVNIEKTSKPRNRSHSPMGKTISSTLKEVTRPATKQSTPILEPSKHYIYTEEVNHLEEVDACSEHPEVIKHERTIITEERRSSKPRDRSHSPLAKTISSAMKEVHRKTSPQSTRRESHTSTKHQLETESFEYKKSPLTTRKNRYDAPTPGTKPHKRNESPESPQRRTPGYASPLDRSPRPHRKSISPEGKKETSSKFTQVKHQNSFVSSTRSSSTTNTKTSASPERRPSKSKTDSPNTPIWADRSAILKKPSAQTPTPTRASTMRTTQKVTSTTSQRINKSSENDDCITSSYGIGPTDENGLPLFGIRALKKKKSQPSEELKQQMPTCETTEEVSGYVVEEKFYSDGKSKPVTERKETVYSSNAEDLEKMKKQIQSQKITSSADEKVVREYKKVDKDYLHQEPKVLMDNEEFIMSSTKNVRRGSVKEMSEKFIRKESSQAMSEKSSTSSYPKAGLILRTSSRLSNTDAGDFASTQTGDLSENDEQIETQRSSCLVTESESECESVSMRKSVRESHSSSTRSQSTKSFLNSSGETKVVTNIDDVLERMRNADNVVEEGDTQEDQEARALLNKFLGASVIMHGMAGAAPEGQEKTTTTVRKLYSESGNPEGQVRTTTTTRKYTNDGGDNVQQKKQVKTTRVTKTIKSDSSSAPVTTSTTCDLEEIFDEEILKELLEQAKTYEERRKIRARLRELMAEREEQNQSSSTTTTSKKSETKDGGVVTTTTKVTTRTVSGSAQSSKPVSVLNKFKQLEIQNSQQSPKMSK